MRHLAHISQRSGDCQSSHKTGVRWRHLRHGQSFRPRVSSSCPDSGECRRNSTRERRARGTGDSGQGRLASARRLSRSGKGRSEDGASSNVHGCTASAIPEIVPNQTSQRHGRARGKCPQELKPHRFQFQRQALQGHTTSNSRWRRHRCGGFQVPSFPPPRPISGNCRRKNRNLRMMPNGVRDFERKIEAGAGEIAKPIGAAAKGCGANALVSR